MPFKSEAQRRWMYANKPKMAKKWEKHTPKGKKLPEKVDNESLLKRIDARLSSPVNIHLKYDNGFSNLLEQILRVYS